MTQRLEDTVLTSYSENPDGTMIANNSAMDVWNEKHQEKRKNALAAHPVVTAAKHAK